MSTTTGTTMRRGVVVSFDAENGFGFIRSRSYPEDVLVHAQTIEGGKTLKAGQRVHFEAEPSDRGPRAVVVNAAGRAPFRIVTRITPDAIQAIGIVLVLVVAMVLVRVISNAPWLWCWLAAINPITFAVFCWDKRRAIIGARPISEPLLLGLAFAGGSPGALLAMPLLRHKTGTGGFRLAFFAIVVVHIAAVLVLWASHRP